MLDPKLIRSDLDLVSAQLARRGFVLDVDSFKELEAQRRIVQSRTQELQNERNSRSKLVGQAKARGEDIQPLLDEMQSFGDELKSMESELDAIQQSLEELLLGIPNLLDDAVPAGKSEDDNLEVFRWKDPEVFTFPALEHHELGTRLGQMDFEVATKIAGSRFVTLNGAICRLQRALTQFMLDLHTAEHGYTEVYVPLMVNAESLKGTGQLPKFEADLFKVSHEPDYFLIPTAEVPVTNLVRDEILELDRPVKWVCHTPCFRSEAGSYGKDTRGMIRQHQFEKVELVQITKPEHSASAHEELTAHAEEVLKRLELAIPDSLPPRPMILRFGCLDRLLIVKSHPAATLETFRLEGLRRDGGILKREKRSCYIP